MTEQINIGDRVKCIARKKIPEDKTNFALLLKIGKVYTVSSYGWGYYRFPVLILNEETTGCVHLQSNFRLVRSRRKP
jgi:hypothetical protein